MRLGALVFTCLLLQGVSRADEVEVVEAVSNDDGRGENSQSQHQDGSDQQQQQQSAQQQQQSSSDQMSDQMSAESENGGANLRGHPARGSVSRPMHDVAYHGPPPPPPQSSASSASSQKSQQQTQPQQEQRRQDANIDKIYDTDLIANNVGDGWPSAGNDMPKIISLDVKCEKSSMKVYLGFDKPFYGIVFSKGHYNNVNCVHLPAGLGRTSVNFEIGIHTCGTAGNTENALYGYGADSGSSTYFENIVVIQYDPQVQEVWDQARKLRCTWHDLYEKSVTFRPFPVDMLDVVRADFAGDNVGCWMQIQVGKGPWASEVSGLVKIGQTMTMVLAIKDDDSKFDMLVRNCMAHDGKRAPIQLVDQRGCITRPKLMSRFTKIKNFGASASVLSYAHFQAFKFPDSMEVHFQCTIQICRYQCPDQCSDPGHSSLLHADGLLLENHRASIGHADVAAYGISPPPIQLPLDAYLQSVGAGRPRDERRRKTRELPSPREKTVGVNRVIRVVSTGDLTFSIDESSNSTASSPPTVVFPVREAQSSNNNSSGPNAVATANLICMTTSGFTFALLLLLAVLLASCGLSTYLCARLRPFRRKKRPDDCVAAATARSFAARFGKSANKACFYS